MKKNLFLILALSALITGHFAFAQDDDDMNSQFEENTAAAGAEPVQKVESEDLKRLSEARKRRSEAAIVKAASQILAKDFNHTEALNTLAVFYAETKRYGISKILLRRALKTNPNEPALHNNLGVIFLIENEPRLALDSFRKSTQLKSGYRIGATNLASIYLEHRDYNRSIAPLEDAYKATKSDLGRGADFAVEIANNYGVALMGVGENSKAEGVFEKILDSNTRILAPHLNYAILLTDVLKKKKDALRVLSKLKLITDERDILRQTQDLEKRAQQE